MITAKCVGSVHFNFTDKESGERISGYNCYFATQDRGQNEHGFHIIKQYVSEENYKKWSLEGAFNTSKNVHLEYGEKGRLYNIEIQ